MDYGDIPTWKECQETQEAIESSDRTVADATRKPKLDPVEQMVYNHEPAGDDDKEFRADLQALVDYLK